MKGPRDQLVIRVGSDFGVQVGNEMHQVPEERLCKP